MAAAVAPHNNGEPDSDSDSEVQILGDNCDEKQAWLKTFLEHCPCSHPLHQSGPSCRVLDKTEIKSNGLVDMSKYATSETPRILRPGTKHRWSVQVECLTCTSRIQIDENHIGRTWFRTDDAKNLDVVAEVPCPECRSLLGLNYEVVPPHIVAYAVLRDRHRPKGLDDVVAGLEDVVRALDSVEGSVDDVAHSTSTVAARSEDVAKEVSSLKDMMKTLTDKIPIARPTRKRKRAH